MSQYYGTVIVKKKNSDEELQHHKYIKREKKNGKWRYWYEDVKDKLGYDEKEAYEKAQNEAEKAEWRLNSITEAERNQYEMEKDLRSKHSKGFVDDVVGDNELDPKDPYYKNKKALRNIYRLYGQAEGFIGNFPSTTAQERRNVNTAKRTAELAKKKFAKTPLGKLENAINRGKTILDKLFDRK